MNADPIELGRFGIRAWQLSDATEGAAVQAARELEADGFGTVWIRAQGFFARARALLQATERLVVASSVISIWQWPAAEVRRCAAALDAHYPGRLLIGIGVSHRPLVDRDEPGRFRRPVSQMRSYLDELDRGRSTATAQQRIIAALGPRMLEVARERALGTHPYLVTPAHSARAREALGPAAVVAPAHVAVLESDPARARALGRRHLRNPYLDLPNYRNTLLGLGFGAEDLADGGSDRLVDALVAWGDPPTVAAQVSEHLRHGADHVALHLLGDGTGGLPRAAWRDLAIALRAANPVSPDSPDSPG